MQRFGSCGLGKLSILAEKELAGREHLHDTCERVLSRVMRGKCIHVVISSVLNRYVGYGSFLSWHLRAAQSWLSQRGIHLSCFRGPPPLEDN